MSDIKHTPGPWHIASGGAVIGRECAVAVVNTYTALQKLTDAEREANACLIAAAPELLAALEWIIEAADDSDNMKATDLVECIPWESIRAAIAKAKGGVL